MGDTSVYFSVLLLYFVMSNYQCLKVIPERTEIVFYHKSYFEDTPIFNVRRYQRRGDYVINLIFTNKIVLDNSVVVDIIFYEYLHNEFRLSFPKMHFALCDLISKDPYVGKTVRKAGLKSCPIQLGLHDVSNMTFNHVIPSVWPFEKGMAEFVVKLGPKDLLLAKGLIVVTFKQDLLKGKT